MSSGGFPILDLPLLPRLDIIKYMLLEHIVKLSVCSKRAARMIREANVPLESISYKFEADDEEVEVRLHAADHRRYYGPFFIRSRLGPLAIWTDKPCAGFEDLERERRPSIFHTAPVASYESVVGHLNHVFRRVMKVNVTISPAVASDRLWQLFHGRISGMLSFSFSGLPLKISAEQCDSLMSNMYAKLLCVNVRIRSSLDYKKGFHQRDVSITFGRWVHLDAVINSTSEDISVNNCRKFRAPQLNALLKLWIGGERMQNLNNLELGGKFRFSTKARNRVLEGVATTKWSASGEGEPPEYIYHYEPMEWNHARVVVERRAVVRVTENMFRLVRLSPYTGESDNES